MKKIIRENGKTKKTIANEEHHKRNEKTKRNRT